jgi:hypothetical protein
MKFASDADGFQPRRSDNKLSQVHHSDIRSAESQNPNARMGT